MESTSSSAKKRKWLILAILGLFCLIVYRDNATVGMTKYEIFSDNLPIAYDQFRIVQLSDVHDAKFGDSHLTVVDKVKKVSPNAIFITGDFIDSNRYNLEQSLLLVEELQFVAPIYYVTGNHEIATNDTERIKGALEDLGVHVLSDEVAIIQSPVDSVMAIGGIEDPLGSSLADDEAVQASIERAFANVPDEMFKVLLSHRPEQFDVYVDRGIDVIFSGHAHGGQFRMPGIGGLVSPGQGWFPKYTSGVHKKGDSHLVISRGLGNSIIPIRLFNQPEIVVVTLRKNE